jgi:hypothetical protein
MVKVPLAKGPIAGVGRSKLREIPIGATCD